MSYKMKHLDRKTSLIIRLYALPFLIEIEQKLSDNYFNVVSNHLFSFREKDQFI